MREIARTEDGLAVVTGAEREGVLDLGKEEEISQESEKEADLVTERTGERKTNTFIKGCLGWGSHTFILTPYLESTGLFTPGVIFIKFCSPVAEILQHTGA